METIWENIRRNEGELFYTTGRKPLELRYHMVDDGHLVFSRTAEIVSKQSFRKVLELMDGQSPAQINKRIRASYYIIALLKDDRIVTE